MPLATRQKFKALRGSMGLYAAALAAAILGVIGLTYATLPAGLDSRADIGAYLDNNLPSTTSGDLPALLSQTGAYSNTPARTPHPGLIPFGVNSALWTDAALKSRYIGLPYGGTTGSPTVGFTPTGAWTFPNGTVFVKNFDLEVNKQTGAIRRLETRILVRLSNGGIRGATYKWLPGETDAQRLDTRTEESVDVIQADGVTVVTQIWTYPSPNDCLTCHNTKSGMVLGVKTAQLNGDFAYPAPGQTDNQLHTWSHLGMFDQTIDDPPTTYARMVDVNNTNATMENRVKSYQDANCSHCHRPPTTAGTSNGPLYDMRYDTPILAPEGNFRIPIVANSGSDGLVRRDIANSSIHARDSAERGNDPMPPIARNVPDQRILALYSQWVNYAFDVNSATATNLTSVALQFDRALEPASAATAANYVINNGVTVLQATLGADPSVVTLTTSAMSAGASYLLTVNKVKELAAPQNPIWPNTEKTFSAPAPTLPGAPSITGLQLGNGQVTFSLAPPANDGGSAILSYSVTCTPGPFGTTGASSPLVVSGLSNGTTYSCSARATNGIGTGPASFPPVDVTPVAGVPDAPTALTAVAGSGSATLSFTAPNDNGAPILSYTAQCDPGGPGVITGGGSQSPITVSGLTNGTAYACSVAATNTSGTGPYSAPASVTPMLPSLLAVVSRKIHGSAGSFDLPLDRAAALNGPVTVESRGDTTHTIVFRFDMPLSSTGTVATSNGSTSAVAVNDEVIVTLTGVGDNQRATLSLTDVNGAGVNVSVSVGFLVGDVNSTRAINQLDVTAMKARAGQPADGSNFWFDLNLSGNVTASEVAAVKARVGSSLN